MTYLESKQHICSLPLETALGKLRKFDAELATSLFFYVNSYYANVGLNNRKLTISSFKVILWTLEQVKDLPSSSSVFCFRFFLDFEFFFSFSSCCSNMN